MCLPYNQWPMFNYELTTQIKYDVNSEEKDKKVLYEIAILSSAVNEGPCGINENCYSYQSKLLRVTAWCLRFISNVRNQKRNLELLTAKEIADASDLWIKYTQKKYFIQK